MNNTTVNAYLRELDSLLEDVDAETRSSLVDGIREELAGLSPSEAADRIRLIGDPAYVAASARVSEPARRNSDHGQVPVTERSWYVALTVVLITIGGFIVPWVGWIAGIVMLWISRAWTTREKWIGMLALLATAAAVVATAMPGVVPGLDPTGNALIWPAIVTLYVLAALLYSLTAAVLIVGPLRRRRQIRRSLV
ncbi:hypothetical protein [Microbacterium wangruii]|uniref:hypothetical protein n=1 Tax=Microbacterium wangruii TaxID=3049073 RepID=UPI00256F5EA2|nr:hypothetical protein [Microbacterium sp. zg-Y1211]MDL5486918.1 hypothetical protein [Microbacterium sp. zg-Y1211]